MPYYMDKAKRQSKTWRSRGKVIGEPDSRGTDPQKGKIIPRINYGAFKNTLMQVLKYILREDDYSTISSDNPFHLYSI